MLLVSGRRVSIYTALFFLGMVGRAVGPLMAAAVFVVSFAIQQGRKVQSLGQEALQMLTASQADPISCSCPCIISCREVMNKA